MANADIVYLDSDDKQKIKSWACGSMTEALLLADDACRKAILIDNGYTMKEVPYMDDVCELWSKERQ